MLSSFSLRSLLYLCNAAPRISCAPQALRPLLGSRAFLSLQGLADVCPRAWHLFQGQQVSPGAGAAAGSGAVTPSDACPSLCSCRGAGDNSRGRACGPCAALQGRHRQQGMFPRWDRRGVTAAPELPPPCTGSSPALGAALHPSPCTNTGVGWLIPSLWGCMGGCGGRC